MKKKYRVMIIALAVFSLVLVAYYFFRFTKYTIHEDDLQHFAATIISERNSSAINNIAICDSDFSNCHAALIYKVDFDDSNTKYYGISFSRLILFSQYRLIMISEYPNSELSGTLLTRGLPYDVVYDMSGYQLIEISRSLSNTLRITLVSLILGVGLFFVLHTLGNFVVPESRKRL